MSTIAAEDRATSANQPRVEKTKTIFGSKDWFNPVLLDKAGICTSLAGGREFISWLGKKPSIAVVRGVEGSDPEARLLSEAEKLALAREAVGRKPGNPL